MGSIIISLLISLIVGCIFGAITQSINESKGYDGGFAWGFWLTWVGIIVVACRQPKYYPPRQSIITPSQSSDSIYSGTFHTSASRAAEQAKNDKIMAGGGWMCSCGKAHPSYETSCTCGKSKYKQITPKSAETPPQENTDQSVQTEESVYTDEMSKIAAIREYKALMDEGILTPEEFEAKKRQLLL